MITAFTGLKIICEKMVTINTLFLETLRVLCLSRHAKSPIRATLEAAGVDLYAAETVIIQPRSRNIVNTDISIKLPKNTYGKIASRSSLASRGIDVAGGVIDRDYTGPIKVILCNHTDQSFEVSFGLRIAQLICEQILLPKIKLVDYLFKKTERGASGFGSTGDC